MAALSLLALLAQGAAPPVAGEARAVGRAPQPVAQSRTTTADPIRRWRPHTLEASRRFGVPLAWIERVMRAESGGHTHVAGRPITSRAGAMGLMQIVPKTWTGLRARLRLGPDPHVPRDNILAGTFYLRLMYDRFGYPGLFGAYNAGPARYAAWLAGKRTLPAETRAYVSKIGGTAARHAPPAPRADGDDPSPPVLFAVRYGVAAPVPPSKATAGGALFVQLSTLASPDQAVD